MTGILLTCLLLILLLAALYVVACLGWPLVEQFWSWLRAPADVRRSPYELAPAPDPVDEQFTTAPRVVAGQDIDDNELIAELQQAYADYRAGVDIYAGARHEPSPEVKQ